MATAAKTIYAHRDIFVVDDDPAVRDALGVVLSMEGFSVTGFADGASFLATARSQVPACVILDVHMPGRSGLDILKELNAHHYPAPIFIISGQGDIPMAVDAIKHGALDFIEKPFDADTVVSRVREAIDLSARRAAAPTTPILRQSFPGAELLTPREREVLGQIAGGASNKEAGRHLGISPRTIEVHRARIMEKLGAKNAADLVRIVLTEIRASA
ncbi:response regulator transcription factor [Phreatobacter sp. AB_2022a]|uniref:response regulator transcription factor n=1 Tax=Phreatobacter sp. AB_2022a TaxID=3003134 RepID=UPI00228766FE|nr:response regulator [Phreatobacter sp. AB_2022a]MCZ0734613.1 response regulator [Phreatobacter sp. AB_2022a]